MRVAPIEHRLLLTGGTVLAVREWPGDGPVVVHHHGVPESRLAGDLLAAAAVARGVRLLTVERPGMGASTGRCARVADFIPLVDEALGRLGVERFAVTGYSGGGPYALATAARLGGRVTKVGLISSAGVPTTWERLTFGWLPSLTMRAGRLVFADKNLGAMAWRLAESIVHRDDREAVRGPAGRIAAASLAECFATSDLGGIDDFRRLIRPWGFDAHAVRQPVWLWHSAGDRICLLGAICAATAGMDRTVRLFPGSGHLAPIAGHADEIIARLTD